MFQEWGFLITEMVMLEILAALLGLFVGWMIWGWGGRSAKLEAELTACRGDAKAKDGKIAELNQALETARAEALAAEKAAMLAAEEAGPVAEAAAQEAHDEDAQHLHALEEERDAARAEALAAQKAAMLAAEEAGPVAQAAADETREEDAEKLLELELERDEAKAEARAAEQAAMQAAAETAAVAQAIEEEHSEAGSQPAALDAPRGGQPDDLKQIKGIGPKLEQLCHELGIYHFDQIAAWSDAEIAWVDANLKGFKGRVTRDGWVEQAKVLAAGGSTEFSQRVESGKVYE